MKSIKLNTKARFFPLKYPRSEVTCQDDMEHIKKVDASSLFLVGKSSAREEKKSCPEGSP